MISRILVASLAAATVLAGSATAQVNRNIRSDSEQRIIDNNRVFDQEVSRTQRMQAESNRQFQQREVDRQRLDNQAQRNQIQNNLLQRQVDDYNGGGTGYSNDARTGTGFGYGYSNGSTGAIVPNQGYSANQGYGAPLDNNGCRGYRPAYDTSGRFLGNICQR